MEEHDLKGKKKPVRRREERRKIFRFFTNCDILLNRKYVVVHAVRSERKKKKK
jgi:hypothetical protein